MIIYCLIFAFIMYAHGLELFYSKLPTTINRIVCISAMAILTTIRTHIEPQWGFFIFSFLAIAIWIIPGWMSEITNALGQNPACPRWRGTLQMTARQCLVIPFIGGLCELLGHSYWLLIGIALMGLPYYATGYLPPNLARFNVVGGHAMVGIIIGAMIWCATI